MSAKVPFAIHRVASPDGATVAELVPDAGMVCASLIYGGDQLLDPGKGLEAYATLGATMGIPLLYPWANRLGGGDYELGGETVTLPADRSRIPLDPNGLPIHGLVPGMMRWRPEPTADGTSLSATLAWSSPELLELFPAAHHAVVDVVAGDGSLTISTSARATAQDSVPVSFGYHPYLRLPGSSRTSWHVELPAMERLVLDERMIPTGERQPMTAADRQLDLADTSWDDGFAVLEQPARFAVSALGRGIAVELLEGYPFAQIYAPPGHDFICFEPMTAPTNALRSGDGLSVLEPGGEYRAVFRVSAWRD